MPNELDQEPHSGQPTVYHIRIRGHLGPQWTDWFGGMTISLEDNGDTILSGPVPDQAALYGLLKNARNLGLPLLSVIPVELEQPQSKERQP